MIIIGMFIDEFFELLEINSLARFSKLVNYSYKLCLSLGESFSEFLSGFLLILVSIDQWAEDFAHELHGQHLKLDFLVWVVIYGIIIFIFILLFFHQVPCKFSGLLACKIKLLSENASHIDDFDLLIDSKFITE